MSGWIGVDLDGTLAEYHGWLGKDYIGPAIPKMKARVQRWLDEGMEVRIFTARVCTGDEEVRRKIQEWCYYEFGVTIEVTHMKDYAMIELWDDRAVQVEKNTGERVDGRP